MGKNKLREITEEKLITPLSLFEGGVFLCTHTRLRRMLLLIMDKKQSDLLTLAHLIKSESEQTRKELTGLFRSELKSVEIKLDKKISSVESKLTKKISSVESKLDKKITGVQKNLDSLESRLDFKIDLLENKLDDKFEEHRRKIVDEIQTFQDAVVKDNFTIHQELTVNSGRITKIEKHLFAN